MNQGIREVPLDDEKFHTDIQVDILARTLWGEAKGSDVYVRKAIANCIVNRSESGKDYWGLNIVDVCLRDEFASYNRSSKEHREALTIDRKDFIFDYCFRLAEDCVDGIVEDTTNGSTHYHHKFQRPAWTRLREPEVCIGDYRFYNLNKPRDFGLQQETKGN